MIQKSTLDFLKALKKNNNREWFEKNKDKYPAENENVDGFNELNMGKLALAGYRPNFIPCTPRGVWHMLKYLKIG